MNLKEHSKELSRFTEVNVIDVVPSLSRRYQRNLWIVGGEVFLVSKINHSCRRIASIINCNPSAMQILSTNQVLLQSAVFKEINVYTEEKSFPVAVERGREA